MRIAVCLVVLALASCSVLEPKPDRTRSYLLSEQPAADSAGRADLALAIGPVDLPAYLDRSEIATRIPPNKLRYSALDRWAEPLSASFARVIAADLGSALGTEDIVEFPWLLEPEVDYRVIVDVEQFERRSDGVAVLVARWQVRRGVRGETLARQRAVLEVPIDGGGTSDAVEALGRATALLAGEIAAAILANDDGG